MGVPVQPSANGGCQKKNAACSLAAMPRVSVALVFSIATVSPTLIGRG